MLRSRVLAIALSASTGTLAAQESHHAHAPAGATAEAGAFRLLDVSLDILTAFGSSTERGASLRALQGGGHDPRERGFTLQNVELSLAGAIDPYFVAEAHLVTFLDAEDGESVLELEEAFLRTQSLPFGLELEMGTFATEFGRLNPLHPHAWHWQDQPVVNTRMFGPDGMRGPGLRLGWLAPTPNVTWLHAGVQNARGEGMVSFLANEEAWSDRPVAGRQFVDQDATAFDSFVYLLRGQTAFDVGEAQNVSLGASAVFGPNATGGQGETLVYGLDLAWRWRSKADDPHAPFVRVEGEWIARRFDAERQLDRNDPGNPGDDVVIPSASLDDWGGYLQALWGIGGHWAVGLRGEYVSGSGASYDAAADTFARAADPFRADRIRVSPLLTWRPEEFARVRLQYNYDDSDALADPAHSVWLGFEVAIGKHSAHD